jgi:hypothetical protein
MMEMVQRKRVGKGKRGEEGRRGKEREGTQQK